MSNECSCLAKKHQVSIFKEFQSSNFIEKSKRPRLIQRTSYRIFGSLLESTFQKHLQMEKELEYKSLEFSPSPQSTLTWQEQRILTNETISCESLFSL